jgi:hypothetical protein
MVAMLLPWIAWRRNRRDGDRNTLRVFLPPPRNNDDLLEPSRGLILILSRIGRARVTVSRGEWRVARRRSEVEKM